MLGIAHDGPVTHSILFVGVALTHVLRPRYRDISVGLATGPLCHLLRNMASGGVPLLWSLTSHLAASSVSCWLLPSLGLLIGGA